MRRILATLLIVAGAVGLLVVGSGAGGDESNYEVRGIFDSAGFLVPGEEVRIAGANVGVVADIDVTREDEAALADGAPDPGKAVIVMRIDDPAFQDFREDASCLVRPQSLLGEKFIECEPTQERAPGTEPPPELAEIPDGEPGEGQRLLPLENNGKSVDLDLVNNISREPYPDRFRLILNDLGAGLAARGDELAEIIERGNPALRETNNVLSILAKQSAQLDRLAEDSDRILGALAGKRDNVADFINQATIAGEATAERGTELEAGLEKLPRFLTELRSTMVELRSFSGAATPVLADLRTAAPSLTRVNKALIPFSSAATTSLVDLGEAAEASGPDLVAADPVVKDIRDLAISGEAGARSLKQLLVSLRKTDGYSNLMLFIFNSVGSINGFDQYGHFLRALLPLNNCVDYETVPEPGCDANFNRTGVAAKAKNEQEKQERRDRRRGREVGQAAAEAVAEALGIDLGDGGGETRAPGPGDDAPAGDGDNGNDNEPPPIEITPEPQAPAPPNTPSTPEVPPATTTPEEAAPPAGRASRPARLGAMRDLLDYVVGRPAQGDGKGGRP